MKDYHYEKFGLAVPVEKKRRRWMKLTAICLGVLMGVGPCAVQEAEEWFWGAADGKLKVYPVWSVGVDG